MARDGSCIRNRYCLATGQTGKGIAGACKNSVSRYLILLVALLLCVTAVDAQTAEPVNVILDTDMASDVDDVGALATLIALEDLGEANILAIGVSAINDWSALCVDAITTFYGRPEIPIGTAKEGIRDHSPYAQGVSEEFPRSRGWNSAADVPDAIQVYRQVLAQQPDNSVTFVTVGPMTNAGLLLHSDPCQHSGLNGRDLVAQKVKRMVTMGGSFGRSHGWQGRPCGRRGWEHNIRADWRASEALFDSHNRWPTPVLFSGFYIGARVRTGDGLRGITENNPVRKAYELYKRGSPDDLDHPSYDACAVHYAVRGFGGPAEGYYYIQGPGWTTIFDEGYGEDRDSDTWYEPGWNGFVFDDNGLHTFKSEDQDYFDADMIAAEIEGLMLHNSYGKDPGQCLWGKSTEGRKLDLNRAHYNSPSRIICRQK